MSKHTTIGGDLAKNVFEVAVSVSPGTIRKSHRLRRPRFVPFFEQQPRATVVMEACGAAHYWGRRLRQMGHKVILLPPHQVRPYVSRNKTDRCDARALLEALRNEDIHPVPIKSVDTQAIAAMHRFRSSWMERRIRLLNMVRGLLREFGVFLPQGPTAVRQEARGARDSGRRYGCSRTPLGSPARSNTGETCLLPGARQRFGLKGIHCLDRRSPDTGVLYAPDVASGAVSTRKQAVDQRRCWCNRTFCRRNQRQPGWRTRPTARTSLGSDGCSRSIAASTRKPNVRRPPRHAHSRE